MCQFVEPGGHGPYNHRTNAQIESEIPQFCDSCEVCLDIAQIPLAHGQAGSLSNNGSEEDEERNHQHEMHAPFHTT